MTKLTSDTLRTYETQEDSNTLPVAANTKIFGGALVGLNETGFARPLQTGDKPVGFAKDGVDNTDGEDGAVKVDLKSRGKVCLDIDGLTLADTGKGVYATDDDTFTLTSGGALVGKIVRVEEPETAIVAFDFLSPATSGASTLSIQAETPVAVAPIATAAAPQVTIKTTTDETATDTESGTETTEEE